MSGYVLKRKLPNVLSMCPASWKSVIYRLRKLNGTTNRGFTVGYINEYLTKFDSKIDSEMNWYFESDRGLLLFEIIHGNPNLTEKE